MEDKSKILIVKSFRDDFEIFCNQRMQQEGINVWSDNIDGRKYSINFVVRQLQMCFRMIKNGWVNDIRAYKSIIIFDCHSLIPWIFLFKRRNTRIILWKWNIATPKIVRQIEIVRNLCEVWTFDMNDADQYNWCLNNQFYFYPQKQAISYFLKREEKKSVFFIGKDKGRYKNLQKIYNILKQYGMYCDFCLVKDKDGQYDINDSDWISGAGMSYGQVLEHISKCDAVLDLVQDSQRGFTLRVLEALFYHKKLITNNKEILKSDVYSANNIFVIDYDSWDNLLDFMQNPYFILPKEVLDGYTFDSWLRNFEKGYDVI